MMAGDLFEVELEGEPQLTGLLRGILWESLFPTWASCHDGLVRRSASSGVRVDSCKACIPPARASSSLSSP